MSVKPLRERFYEKVRLDPTTGCVLWTGCRDKNGYGYISVYEEGRKGGRRKLAHRASWELTNGPIPDGMYICHHCDTPSCVNPKHLFLGTPQDNIVDMVLKNRHGKAVLTAEDVVEIRRTWVPKQVTKPMLAAKYGVSISLIEKVLSRDVWGHL